MTASQRLQGGPHPGPVMLFQEELLEQGVRRGDSRGHAEPDSLQEGGVPSGAGLPEDQVRQDGFPDPAA